LLFFFSRDDDPWTYGEHQRAGFSTDRIVLEESVDIRNIGEHRRATFGSTFTESFDTAHQDRSSVWNADGRADRRSSERWLLNGGTFDELFLIVSACGRLASTIEDARTCLRALSSLERELTIGSFQAGELRHQRQSYESFVLRDNRLDVHLGAFAQDHDNRLLCNCEVSDDRVKTDNERPEGLVVDGTHLSIEHGDLRSLEDVLSAIALGGLQEEEQFQVAEDRETHLSSSGQVWVTKRWVHAEATIADLDIEVCGERWDGSRWPIETYNNARTGVFAWQGSDVVVDLHIEVHTHFLEERILQLDESDFDGYLKVLESAEALQQICDLLVSFLRSIHDKLRFWRNGFIVDVPPAFVH